MKKKAVCLLSGGLDSTVSAYIAHHDGYELSALTFHYNQRHDKEISCAQTIAQHLGIKHHSILEINFHDIISSALLQSSSTPISEHSVTDIGSQIPPTYVPARNTIFLSYALGYAETITADAIVLGVNAVDYSGYPDCRPKYIQAYQAMANLATKQAIEGKPINLYTPLLHLTKTEIIKRGTTLKVPFEHTWSCYKGSDKACGTCDSCLLRLKGFMDAHLKDPLVYSTYPTWYTK